MSIDLLKNNIEKEKQILKSFNVLKNRLQNVNNSDEKKFIINSLNALLSQLNILNNALPDIINNIGFYKNLSDQTKAEVKKSLVNVKYVENDVPLSLAIKKQDQTKFLKNITSQEDSDKKESLRTSLQSYIVFSNKIFKKRADRVIEGGSFKFIKEDLRRITSPFLVNTYISMMFMTVLISFLFGLFFGALLLLFGISWIYSLSSVFVFPLIVFAMFLLYPSSTRKSLEKNINQELPFLTIYLAAISTSGIEPSKIFSILAASQDYPYTRREVKKLINYINFYGYDLVNALKTISGGCPSERLALLFDGLSTTITSGGELSAFLNKHSETLLFDYRLEREKYTRVAETFMDIYISVIIAAPMILMMLFILMSLTSFSSSFISPSMLTMLVILLISGLNIGFLLFLNIKQPKF